MYFRPPAKLPRMRRLLLLVFTLLAGCATAAPAAPVGTTDFGAMLERQAEDWNRGDFAAFCAVYADDATFVSPSGVTRGRAKILARYEEKYDTPDKRGRLAFEIIETRREGRAATVMMRWRITKADSEASGHALIVLFETEAGWRIVQDASM